MGSPLVAPSPRRAARRLARWRGAELPEGPDRQSWRDRGPHRSSGARRGSRAVMAHTVDDAGSPHIRAGDEAVAAPGYGPGGLPRHRGRRHRGGGRRLRRRPSRLRVPERERHLRPHLPAGRAGLRRPRAGPARAVRRQGPRLGPRPWPLACPCSPPPSRHPAASTSTPPAGIPRRARRRSCSRRWPAAAGGACVRSTMPITSRTPSPRAAREAEAAFGDGALYAEAAARRRPPRRGPDRRRRIPGRALPRARVLAPALAPEADRVRSGGWLDDGLRRQLHDAAVRLGEHVGYDSIGTVEFLVAGDRVRVHRAQCPAAGRAHRHRGDLRHRPGPLPAAPRRRRDPERARSLRPTPCPTASRSRPAINMETVGPRRRHRPRRAGPSPGSMPPTDHRVDTFGRGGLRDQPPLRLAAGQAHRPRR